jgi:hypothetical protein|tara:strand:- start:632 stop:898 length:267 start_codon:yes stop_codon:yes gene_type:complete
MKKNTRSILQELNSLHVRDESNADLLVESTANNIINSSINLINMIHKNYDNDTAGELERRFLNSIRSGDPKKFRRGIQKIIESKRGKK